MHISVEGIVGMASEEAAFWDIQHGFIVKVTTLYYPEICWFPLRQHNCANKTCAFIFCRKRILNPLSCLAFKNPSYNILTKRKYKPEDMDISSGMSAARSGPTLQTWITQKWLNIFMSFFSVWKSGIFVTIWNFFHAFLSNRLWRRAFWKWVFKKRISALGRNMWFSKKHQKVPDFDNTLWPNHFG